MGSNLRRRSGTYWFRRRVPDALRTLIGRVEINRSLQTTCARTARERARQAWLTTDTAFRTMAYKSLSQEQAELIIHRLLAEPLWASPTTAELADDDAALDLLFRHAADVLPGLSREDGQRLLHSMERLTDKLEVREAARSAEWHGLRARLQEIKAAVAQIGEARAEKRAEVSAAAAAKAEVDLIVARRVADREAGVTPGPRKAKPGRPPLSALVESFFGRRRDVDEMTHQVIGQERGTLRRFLEECGDRSADAYDRGDITRFLGTLRRLPATYGKSPKDKARSLAEIIARADEAKEERLSDRTVKRHLSALSQFFGFVVDQGHLSGAARAELVDGHRFRLEKGARDQRDAWSSAELKALFASPVWTGCHPHFRSERGPEILRDARFWLPLLALFHGARLEEYADLYRRDVCCDEGTWAVRLVESETEDGARRRLKTANATRTVPLHSEIIRLGFLDHVQRTARDPGDPLFPDLRPQGKDGKRGPRMTRWFVQYRKAVHLYREGVGMHAFRHTANTRLRDAITDWQQERHVAYLLGHSQGGGEGRERYDKGPGLRAAAETLNLLRYPELDLRHLQVASA